LLQKISPKNRRLYFKGENVGQVGYFCFKTRLLIKVPKGVLVCEFLGLNLLTL
jgi:hypothetical protein